MNKAYKKETLGNGLRIVAHPMSDRQSLALGIWINVGGRYEQEGNKGISHVLEHLLFKGTRKYSCNEIKESIEGIGGALNGFTSEELTCYLVKIPGKYMELALDILSDMVLNPTLPQEELAKEKTVILEEIKMYKDQPQSYVYELLDELLWPRQALGSPVIGTVESVNRITRQDLELFKQNSYTAPNIIISAAGSLSFSKLTKKAADIFSAIKARDKNEFIKAHESQIAPQVKIFNKDTEQTHMALGFHSLKRGHPLKHALGILHIILGANMSSRLFNELREKRGLAYEIGTSVKRFSDTGAFIVHAGIDNNKLNEAVELILKELQKIKSQLVSGDEFKRAREFYLGQLMIALEDTLDHMLWIGETSATLDKVYSLEQIEREVRRVKRGDVLDTAQEIFKKEKLNLALIGPLKENESQVLQSLYLE